MTTNTLFCFLRVTGNCVMKSIVMVSNRSLGMGNGCNNPAGAWLPDFVVAQTKQVLT